MLLCTHRNLKTIKQLLDNTCTLLSQCLMEVIASKGESLVQTPESKDREGLSPNGEKAPLSAPRDLELAKRALKDSLK